VTPAVHPLIRIGLELPPLGAEAGRRKTGVDSIALPEVARLAENAGIGVLWLAEAPPGGIDPMPLAGSLAGCTSRIGIGIVVRPSRGRHPSVVARDVTTIDMLTGGRAAVALVEDGRRPLDVDRLAEATAIVHALLTEEEVSIAGRFYEVAELTTRPRPVHDRGPLVIAGFVEPPPHSDSPAESILVGGSADAYVSGGGPPEVAACRARLDGATPPGSDPVLVWRGGFPAGAPAEFATSIFEAGADGMIAVLDDDAAVRGAFQRGVVERVLDAMAP
jgi:alkanesulfonate monooxygenase SsuD/methylene tetrahydromethanopterin reductase-like flavin-dependent oxidoreductase (luciferase family)